MIYNTQDLAVTRERIAHLERLLETLRKTVRPEEWQALSCVRRARGRNWHP